MKEQPILFSGAMVRAIRDGRKTMTRRIINRVAGHGKVTDFGESDTPGYDFHFRCRRGLWQDYRVADLLPVCPYGQPGDRLYVRETWATLQCYDDMKPRDMRPDAPIAYVCDGMVRNSRTVRASPLGITRPSIFMPRWASRLILDVTDVQIARLQNITQKDAMAEGFMKLPATGRAVLNPSGQYFGACWSSPRAGFLELWDKLNAKRGFPWASNPWVWVISFRRAEE